MSKNYLTKNHTKDQSGVGKRTLALSRDNVRQKKKTVLKYLLQNESHIVKCQKVI